MNSISIFLVLVVLVSVGHGQQCLERRAWPVVSYLSRPIIKEHEPAAFDWIKTILEELKLSQPEEILKFFQETNMNMMKKGTMNVNYKGKYITVADEVSELIQLADNGAKLTENTIDNYVKLVEHVFGKLEVMSMSSAPTHDVGLFNYLSLYGTSKFSSFAKDLNNDYVKLINRFSRDTERVLDELVSSQDDNNNETMSNDDNYLTKLASNIDLVHGQFDAKELLKAAKRHRVNIWDEKGKSEFLFGFIGIYCNGLVNTFGKLLDVVNMIRLLSPESFYEFKLPEKLIKFNEYGRICHQRLDSATSEQVKESINKGLESLFSRLFKKVAQCS